MSTANKSLADTLADAFLRWPLPESVCADLCTTRQELGRCGTNLLSFAEAKAMMEQVVLPVLAGITNERLRDLELENTAAWTEVEKLKGSAKGKQIVALRASLAELEKNQLSLVGNTRAMRERLSASQASLAEREAELERAKADVMTNALLVAKLNADYQDAKENCNLNAGYLGEAYDKLDKLREDAKRIEWVERNMARVQWESEDEASPAYMALYLPSPMEGRYTEEPQFTADSWREVVDAARSQPKEQG